MTATVSRPESASFAGDPFDQTRPRYHPGRWHLSRAGFVNVWHYLDNTFELSGGRLILRGTNGSGKSRALEMLLPFLLDADRRRMGASSDVTINSLMETGAGDQSNRLGYLWLELVRDAPGGDAEHLTLGAHIRWARGTGDSKVLYFTTALRVGYDLHLLDDIRNPLSKLALEDQVGADRVTDNAERHRERVRTEVFGLSGDVGRDRFNGLLKLLHRLRDPDVGNHIDAGLLPVLLSEALPPLSERALEDAGVQLDGLVETKENLARLEAALTLVNEFFGVYRRYVTGVLREAAGATDAAADAVQLAEAAAAELRASGTELDAQARAMKAQREEQETRVEHLSGRIADLRQSAAYADSRDLDELANKVEALATGARTALGAAGTSRQSEQLGVDAADRCAEEILQAGRAVSAELSRLGAGLTDIGSPLSPGTVVVDRAAAAVVHATVRTGLQTPPEQITRPVPTRVTLAPDSLDELAASVVAAREHASQRARQAANRAEEARALSKHREHVRLLIDRAGNAEEAATRQADAAAEQAAHRDDVAVEHALGWRSWADSPQTGEVLGRAEWSDHPALAVVLADSTALCGSGADDDDGVSLADLGRVGDLEAELVGRALADQSARLDLAERADDTERRGLTQEQRTLQADQDPEPPLPSWISPDPVSGSSADGVGSGTRNRTGTANATGTAKATGAEGAAAEGAPLWRCLDFRADLPDAERAGLEGALLASGPLTARVDETGTLVAGDGQLLVSAAGRPAANSAAAALVADPQGPVGADVLGAIIARIGYVTAGAGAGVGDHDGTGHLSVSGDGSWRNGPLRGRYRVEIASFIGAAARAANRARRLQEIAVRLGELQAAAQQRADLSAQIAQRRAAVQARLRDRPDTRPLDRLRAQVAQAESTAADLLGQARSRRVEADTASREQAEAERAHRDRCQEFGLPTEADRLAELSRAAQGVARRCDTVTTSITGLGARRTGYARALAAIEPLVGQRSKAEAAAEFAIRGWRAETARLQTLRAAIGADVEKVLADLEETKRRLDDASTAARDAYTEAERLGRAAERAAAQADAAEQESRRRAQDLAASVAVLRHHLAQPGVPAAAFAGPAPAVLDDPHPVAVKADCAILLSALKRANTDVNALSRAQHNFERSITGSYDVVATISDHGLWLYELLDATGRLPLAGAAAELDRRCTEGRTALTEREQEVFRRFVLGGVGEELRQRINQAEHLVGAMNTSLASIRTSHGIGVTLSWRLADDSGGDTHDILALVRVAVSMRTAAQNAKLTELLSARVEAERSMNKSDGYAVHLRNALDYRRWHTIDVRITGPAPGQERRLSRRAKLSQGETRFVSYVTLFAAADAYLSGLDSERALRLILLDDAFAKVDERTIAELLGLLVRLDVDFVMTGHALWGCVPQVPALDVYEVCRDEGSAAITAHVHWDGRNRTYLRGT